MKILGRLNHPLVEVGVGFAPSSVVHSLAESGDKLGALACAGLGAFAVLHGIYRYDQAVPELSEAASNDASQPDISD